MGPPPAVRAALVDQEPSDLRLPAEVPCHPDAPDSVKRHSHTREGGRKVAREHTRRERQPAEKVPKQFSLNHPSPLVASPLVASQVPVVPPSAIATRGGRSVSPTCTPKPGWVSMSPLEWPRMQRHHPAQGRHQVRPLVQAVQPDRRQPGRNRRRLGSWGARVHPSPAG